MENLYADLDLALSSYEALLSIGFKDSDCFDAYFILSNFSRVFFSNVTRVFLSEQYKHFEDYGIIDFCFFFLGGD